jgi:predicted nucleic acid-binding protein
MIHLDTSFLIRALTPGSPQDQRVRAWLLGGETLSMSAIAWAEFLCGPVEPSEVDLVVQVVSQRLSFTEEDAALAARLFNDSGRRRGSLADCMVAAAAIHARAALATENPRDFRRFEAAGLRLASDQPQRRRSGGS